MTEEEIQELVDAAVQAEWDSHAQERSMSPIVWDERHEKMAKEMFFQLARPGTDFVVRWVLDHV